MNRKIWQLFLFFTVLLLAVACVPVSGEVEEATALPQGVESYPGQVDPAYPAAQDVAYPGQDGGELPPDAAEMIEPPPATLTIDGRSQSSGIGSYCWSDQSGQAVCADMLGIPTDAQPLSAPSTFTAEFELPLSDTPGQVVLDIFPATDDLALPGEAGGWRWWQTGETSQIAVEAVQNPSVELTLDRGTYVLALFAMWPDHGSVSYGFLVEIDGPAVSDATATPGEGEDSLEGAPSSDSEQGVVSVATTADGRSIYLPIQPPVEETMQALIEGELVEVDGCLRLVNEDYPDGFLLLWPSGSDIQVMGEGIAVLNSERAVVARVGEPLTAGGGAMESEETMAFYDRQIRDMPIEACPGPYWVAASLQALP